jgi:hypothetical protein
MTTIREPQQRFLELGENLHFQPCHLVVGGSHPGHPKLVGLGPDHDGATGSNAPRLKRRHPLGPPVHVFGCPMGMSETRIDEQRGAGPELWIEQRLLNRLHGIVKKVIADEFHNQNAIPNLAGDRHCFSNPDLFYAG